MADAFVLSGDSVRQLREIARRVIREEVGTLQSRQRVNVPSGLRIHTLRVTSTGDISGLSTATAGSGLGTIHYLSTAGVLTELSTNTVTVYNSGASTIRANDYVQVVQDNRGTLWTAGSAAQATIIGKLNSNTTHTDVGTLTIWDQSGTSMPASTTGTIEALNITGETLTSAVFMQVQRIQMFEKPIMFPWELQPCSTST